MQEGIVMAAVTSELYITMAILIRQWNTPHRQIVSPYALKSSELCCAFQRRRKLLLQSHFSLFSLSLYPPLARRKCVNEVTTTFPLTNLEMAERWCGETLMTSEGGGGAMHNFLAAGWEQVSRENLVTLSSQALIQAARVLSIWESTSIIVACVMFLLLLKVLATLSKRVTWVGHETVFRNDITRAHAHTQAVDSGIVDNLSTSPCPSWSTRKKQTMGKTFTIKLAGY